MLGMPDSPSGMITGLISSLVGTGGVFLWLRSYLTKDKLNRSIDGGATSVVVMLREQLDLERNRSTGLLQALEKSNSEVAELKQQVIFLTTQVQRLEAIVKELDTSADKDNA